jgi:GT2 family glycosyltransferase
MEIAVIITVHNRIDKTLICLDKLFNQDSLIDFDVYLTNDGSTDDTKQILREKFPKVKIIEGDGNLFWNKGMLKAWEIASNIRNYDFYLWLNNDTYLFEHAINELLASFRIAKEKEGKDSIIIGSCKESISTDYFSYGGKDDKGPLLPGEKIKKVKYINGNLVLISKNIFKTLGNLSVEYTHSFGDYDYGLRASEENIKCYAARGYLAVCETNKNQEICFNSNYSLAERLRNVYKEGGFNINDYMAYRSRFFKKTILLAKIKLFLKIIFVRVYFRLKKIKS